MSARVNGLNLHALIDMESSENFIDAHIVETNKWKISSCSNQILMATSSLSCCVIGYCMVNIELKENFYSKIKLLVMRNLCCEVVLGHNFHNRHSHLTIPFGGTKPALQICGLATAKVQYLSLFSNLTSDCKSIAIKSRCYSLKDKELIAMEVKRLLKENITEPRKSPGKAQFLIMSNENPKKKMVVDYSQTINRYTQHNAYPLPRIDEKVSDISKYHILNTLDLRSAYHQIPIKLEEKPYMAFEACGHLYQFRRIPFGVTNGVASFQRVIDEIISNEKFKGTVAYIDNVTVCSYNKEDHNHNLKQFMAAVNKYGLTLNKEKCSYNLKSIKLLGYIVRNGAM